VSKFPRILVITDRTQARTTIENVVRELCDQEGCSWILFRERDLPPLERRSMAERLRIVTNECGAKLSVSADAALAADIGADGVHLQRVMDIAGVRAMMPKGWIGVSAHNLADVRMAKEHGADYVTLSPIFPSESKPGYGPPLGLETIRQAAKIGIPVLALGGVTPRSAQACLEAGAHGLAVMGTVMRAKEPGEAIRRYAAAFATCSRPDE
jgi:thiamine-phosphate pyrophosphorylase